MLRYENAAGRGPTGSLWVGIVDEPNGVNSLDLGSGRVDDFTPYLGDAVGITLSGDTGVTAAIQSDVPHGAILLTATQAADAVTGFSINQNVDLDATGFKRFCMEARVKVNDDNDTTQTFICLTDEALDGMFGTDNTPDGSAIGVRWNGDETMDLVSISSTDVITVLADAFTTVVRTVGFVKIGFRIDNIDGTNYRVVASVSSGDGDDAVNVTTSATTTTIPGAAMKPSVVETNDNEAAPSIEVDWYAYRVIADA